MSNTNIVNIQTSDTFQTWLNTTNDLVDVMNENVMLAGPGAGYTIQGNSTLIGSFTANTINSTTSTINTLSAFNILRPVDQTQPIAIGSPINLNSTTENIFNIQTPSGFRPIIRMINGGNARWLISHDNTASNSSISIRVEGSVTPQMTLSQTGRLTVNQLEGDGSLITNLSSASVSNLDASKITSGIFDIARIPNLDASKITTGILADTRIPNLNASKITAGVLADARIPNLDASKITTGVLGDARIPTTIVRTSRNVNSSNGITGGGNLSSDLNLSLTGLPLAILNLASNGLIVRTGTSSAVSRSITGFANQINVSNGDGVSGNPSISAVIASKEEAEAGLDNTKLMTSLRVAEAIRSFDYPEVLVNTTSQTNIIFPDLVEGSYDFFIENVQNTSSSTRTLNVFMSSDNGATWLLCAAGTGNNYLSYRCSGLLSINTKYGIGIYETSITTTDPGLLPFIAHGSTSATPLKLVKPATLPLPINAIRFAWNANQFGTDVNQKITMKRIR